MSDNVILVGFMGTGKDTVGRELARHTGKVFLSIDRMIELHAGMTIKDLFASRGETYFRRKENEILYSIKDLKNLVVATGGGIVLKIQNQKLLRAMGSIIRLDAQPDVIAARIKNFADRPLLKNQNNIARIMRKRKGKYDFADIEFNTSYRNPASIAREIEQVLHLKKNTAHCAKRVVKIKTNYKNYEVMIDAGLLRKSRAIRPLTDLGIKRAIVLTNPLVGALYEERVRKFLRNNGIAAIPFIIPDGESSKTLDVARSFYDFLIEQNITRDDAIVALGGGVIGDIAGFVAATYKRGTRFIQVPTTLLAQVDASIGGKCGVNHQRGKNMIGTFYQPDLVISDIELLFTLSLRDFRNGLAEVIKYGIICDKDFFSLLEKRSAVLMARELSKLALVIMRSVKIKGRIVSNDEYERKGRREILNIGHSIGHAIESITRFREYSHGEAVAIGIIAEARRAVNGKLLKENVFRRIIKIMQTYGLPTAIPEYIEIGHIKDALVLDKKISDGKIRLPMIRDIGQVIIKEVSCKTFL